MLLMVLETGLELLRVNVADHRNLDLQQVDVEHPIDNIASLDYWGHTQQARLRESALVLTLAPRYRKLTRQDEGELHGPAVLSRCSGAAATVGLEPSMLHIFLTVTLVASAVP